MTRPETLTAETTTPAPASAALPDPAELEREAEAARTQLERAHRWVRAKLGDVGPVEGEVGRLRAMVSAPLFGVKPGCYVAKQVRVALGALGEFTVALAEARGLEVRQQEALARLEADLGTARADPEMPPVILERLEEARERARESTARAGRTCDALHEAVERAGRVEGVFHAAAGRQRAAAARLVPQLIAEAAGRTIEHVRGVVLRSRRGVEAAEHELRALLAESESAFGPVSVSRVVWKNTAALDEMSVGLEQG